MRALSVIRLSVLTDETTSPERQRAANETAAAAVGAHIAHEAVDLGVSASKTSPFERPELRKWLEAPDSWDALVAWRFDRVIRSMRDMNELADWAADHHKVIIFAEGPGGRLVLDFRTGVDLVTRLLLQVFSFAAEFEAQSIRDRVTSAQAAMRMMPLRWRGSRPPYGYEPAALDAGGWTLVPDAEAVAVIERIVKNLMGGASLQAIALALTAEGVPTPRDHWRMRKNRSAERAPWNGVSLAEMLRSPVLLGHKTHRGRTIYSADGTPVMATNTPVLTRSEYDAVSALLAERSSRVGARRDTNALLLGVALCDSCGRRMYLNTQQSRPGQRPTYKCNSKSNGYECAAPVSLRADWLDAYAEDEFITAVGPMRVSRTRQVPGYDPAIEIAELTADLTALTESAAGARSQAARTALAGRIAALDARLALLEAEKAVPARTEVIYSGRSYAEEWAAADTAGRRAMLLDAGAVIRVTTGRAGGWRSLDASRVSFTLGNEFFTEGALELGGIDYA